MKCEECREKLSAYLDGAAEDAAGIKEHLAGCAACQGEKEMLEEMMAVLKSLPDEELPEGYHAELMQKLQAEAAPNVVPFPKKKKPRWRQMSMIAAAALIVVAVGGGNGILQMRRNQQEAVQQMEMDAEKISVYDTDGVAEEAVAEEVQDGSGVMQTEKKQTPVQVMEKPTARKPVQTQQTEKPVQTQQSGTPKLKTQRETVTKGTQIDVTGKDTAAMPYAASETAAEEAVGDAVTNMRSSNVSVKDEAVLRTADVSGTKEKISAAIAEIGGYEEGTAQAEITAMIPAEAYDGFVETLEGLGELEWTTQTQAEADAEYHGINIQLEEKK